MHSQFEPEAEGGDTGAAALCTGLQRFEWRTELRQVSFYISGLIEQAALWNDFFYKRRSASDAGRM